jgi:AcrR family transcriptional regulator
VTPAVAARSRRQEILDAALEAFTEKGFAAATIEDVRTRSGASTGSIYHHFGGKEAIAAALYVEGLADYQRGFLRTLRREHEPEARVRELVRHHLRWIARNAPLARFIFNRRETEVREATEQPLAQMNRRFFSEVTALLEPQFESGELRRMPADVFNSVLIGPSQEFSRHWLAGRTRTSIKAAEGFLADAAWEAVRGEGD